MKRSAKYSLKFATRKKKALLMQTFEVYKRYLRRTITLMWNGDVAAGKYMSSPEIIWMDDLNSSYKQMIYQHASSIIRGNSKNKPKIKNVCINFTQRDIAIEESNNSFDKWLRLKLPFIKEGYKSKKIEILIPIKEHKHSLQFNDWKQAKSVRVSKTYATFVFEKEEPFKKETGKTIGVDQGFKKLLVTSDGQVIGKDFEKLYEKITRKQQGSKAFERALRERDQEIDFLIKKKLNLNGIKEIKVEALKGIKKDIKKKKRFNKEFRNKFQRWVYAHVLRRLESHCQLNRVQLTHVDPAYSSQTCSKCSFIHASNRNLEKFKCVNCGYEADADHNAARIIAGRSLNAPIPNVDTAIVELCQ